MRSQAEQHEELVPVRVDIDWDKIKLRDTFTFNLHERIISPEYFAQQMIEDMGLKLPGDKPVIDEVVKQVKDQLAEFFPSARSDEDALDPELPYSAYKNDEMRILVKLNITIGAHTLVDQFEWEINNPMNSPEDFAAGMARDYRSRANSTTAIAHCIREQAQAFTRSLYIVGHPFDGRPVETPTSSPRFFPRHSRPSFGRSSRQRTTHRTCMRIQRQSSSAAKPSSPESSDDRSAPSTSAAAQCCRISRKSHETIRTLIVSSVLPGAAANADETRLYKRATGIGATGRGKRALRDGEISDSEESAIRLPTRPPCLSLQGTARTRGMRGAANGAAQRMGNLGRSETPEAIIHHHETRTARRLGGRRRARRPRSLSSSLSPSKSLPRDSKSYSSRRRRKQPARAPSDSATPRPASAAPGSMGPPSTPQPRIEASLPSRPRLLAPFRWHSSGRCRPRHQPHQAKRPRSKPPSEQP